MQRFAGKTRAGTREYAYELRKSGIAGRLGRFATMSAWENRDEGFRWVGTPLIHLTRTGMHREQPRLSSLRLLIRRALGDMDAGPDGDQPSEVFDLGSASGSKSVTCDVERAGGCSHAERVVERKSSGEGDAKRGEHGVARTEVVEFLEPRSEHLDEAARLGAARESKGRSSPAGDHD